LSRWSLLIRILSTGKQFRIAGQCVTSLDSRVTASLSHLEGAYFVDICSIREKDDEENMEVYEKIDQFEKIDHCIKALSDFKRVSYIVLVKGDAFFLGKISEIALVSIK